MPSPRVVVLLSDERQAPLHRSGPARRPMAPVRLGHLPHGVSEASTALSILVLEDGQHARVELLRWRLPLRDLRHGCDVP
eukprot:8496312-Lingulodinium_polyedra.AAC.1